MNKILYKIGAYFLDKSGFVWIPMLARPIEGDTISYENAQGDIMVAEFIRATIAFKCRIDMHYQCVLASCSCNCHKPEISNA